MWLPPLACLIRLSFHCEVGTLLPRVNMSKGFEICYERWVWHLPFMKFLKYPAELHTELSSVSNEVWYPTCTGASTVIKTLTDADIG